MEKLQVELGDAKRKSEEQLRAAQQMELSELIDRQKMEISEIKKKQWVIFLDVYFIKRLVICYLVYFSNSLPFVTMDSVPSMPLFKNVLP